MPEISKEKLAKYEEAMDLLHGYEGGASDRWRRRRLDVLKPIHTPLVSDEELWGLGTKHYGAKRLSNTGVAFARGVLALGFRNAAEWFENDNRNVAAATQLRKWVDGETS